MSPAPASEVTSSPSRPAAVEPAATPSRVPARAVVIPARYLISSNGGSFAAILDWRPRTGCYRLTVDASGEELGDYGLGQVATEITSGRWIPLQE
jgi:hypothetical protein